MAAAQYLTPSDGAYDVPLASPMRWDPHSGQLSFASLASLEHRAVSVSPPKTSASLAHTGRPLFLGLDLSTQALKGCFANDTLEIEAEYGVRFDEDFPELQTTKGVHMGEGGLVTSPVIMFIKAIDLLFQRIAASDVGKDMLRRTVAVSGAAQQHATVYWSEAAPRILDSLDPALSLAEQFQDAFSSPTSPNWQDSSTTRECQEMEAAIGGAEEMAKRTGSRAHERFSGPQIMKLRKTRPEVYNATSRISLVSSFLTTVLCADGQVKPIEESDASGMSMWGLEDGEDWDEQLLSIVAGGDKAGIELAQKLGPVEKDGGVSAGSIGRYFVERYGMHPDAVVCHVTGDNNATLLSFSLLTGEVVVSLGTSDTILLSTVDYAPNPDSHLFSYPANRSGGKRSYMAMLCYKNGSLPREHIRDQYANKSWEKFNSFLQAEGQPTSSHEAAQRPFGFYFLKPEIIPHNAYGQHRINGSDERVKEFQDERYNARAVLESQFLSFRTRVKPMMASTETGLPERIFAVGGGSVNTTLLDVLSTVLGSPVYKPRAAAANSCAQGGCFKAYWCWVRRSEPEKADWVFEEAVREARERGRQREQQDGNAMEDGASAELVAEPAPGGSELYGLMEERFKRLESTVVAHGQA